MTTTSVARAIGTRPKESSKVWWVFLCFRQFGQLVGDGAVVDSLAWRGLDRLHIWPCAGLLQAHRRLEALEATCDEFQLGDRMMERLLALGSQWCDDSLAMTSLPASSINTVNTVVYIVRTTSLFNKSPRCGHRTREQSVPRHRVVHRLWPAWRKVSRSKMIAVPADSTSLILPRLGPICKDVWEYAELRVHKLEPTGDPACRTPPSSWPRSWRHWLGTS